MLSLEDFKTVEITNNFEIKGGDFTTTFQGRGDAVVEVSGGGYEMYDGDGFFGCGCNGGYTSFSDDCC